METATVTIILALGLFGVLFIIIWFLITEKKEIKYKNIHKVFDLIMKDYDNALNMTTEEFLFKWKNYGQYKSCRMCNLLGVKSKEDIEICKAFCPLYPCNDNTFTTLKYDISNGVKLNKDIIDRKYYLLKMYSIYIRNRELNI